MSEELKQLRKKLNITQQQAADYLGISVRSYKSYENDETKSGTIKYGYLLQKLEELSADSIRSEGLSADDIGRACHDIFEDYNLSYSYLFGSFAKGTETKDSDVDILISGEVRGLKFYGLVEKLQEAVGRKVDLLNVDQLSNNPQLLDEILRDGIKIYG